MLARVVHICAEEVAIRGGGQFKIARAPTAKPLHTDASRCGSSKSLALHAALLYTRHGLLGTFKAAIVSSCADSSYAAWCEMSPIVRSSKIYIYVIWTLKGANIARRP